MTANGLYMWRGELLPDMNTYTLLYTLFIHFSERLLLLCKMQVFLLRMKL